MENLATNDPCSCGSGKNYNDCCLTGNKIRNSDDRSEAISKAVEWLMKKHKEAVSAALDSLFFGNLDDNDHDFLQTLGDEVIENMMGNAFEWLLADGAINRKDKKHHVSELLLGKNGPQLSVGQRQRIELMSTIPLRLYEIVEVKSGESLTLRDAIQPDRPPVLIQNQSSSKCLSRYDFFATRILPIEDHFELSGAAYGFPRTRSLDLIKELREGLKNFDYDSPLTKEILSVVIPYYWLRLFLNPFELPPLADQLIGESFLFVTDLYKVRDWATLEQVLSAVPDIEGNREAGWIRSLDKVADGQPTRKLSIYISTRPDRIKVFYPTQKDAEENQQWFEKLAGANVVVFFSRETSDLEDVLAHFHPHVADEPIEVTP